MLDHNEFVGEVLTLIHVPAFPSFHMCALHPFPVVRFNRLRPRSWIGFGRSILRGRSVSGHLGFNCCGVLPLPSSPLSSPLPSAVYVMLHRDISIDVFSRGVLTNMY